MAQTKKEAQIAILGGGLAGLTLAALLEKQGADYFLVEGTNEYGGSIRGQNENGTVLDFGIKSIPLEGPLDENPLYLLNKTLDLNLGIDSDDSPTLFWEKGELNPFMGLGEIKDTVLAEELTYYVKSPRLWPTGGWQNLVNKLLEIIPPGKRMLRGQVVRLEMDGKKIVRANLNGDSFLHADTFLWTLPPAHLLELLPAHSVSNKNTKALTKNRLFTAISMDFMTRAPVSDLKNTVLLRASSEEEFFIVGRFISNVDLQRRNNGNHLSSWLTLVDAEKSESEEEVSKTIRSAKRCLFKAFPEFSNEKPWERIIVAPDSLGMGMPLSLTDDFKIAEVNNLHLCGGSIELARPHIGGAIAAARHVIQALNPNVPPREGVVQENPELQI